MFLVYINLDRSTDRREFMEQQLSRFLSPGDVAERIEAIPMRSGIAGCMASHFKAIKYAFQQATDRDYPYFVVCEDNFQFVKPIDWEAVLRDAPEDWVVLQLQTSNPGYASDRCKFVPNKRQHWGAKIYMVKTSRCQEIIDYIQGDPKRMTRDADQVVYEGVKSYTLLKPIGLIKRYPSTIAKWHDRFADKFLGKFTEQNLTSHPYWVVENEVENNGEPVAQKEMAVSDPTKAEPMTDPSPSLVENTISETLVDAI
jgi:hypothetical protein